MNIGLERIGGAIIFDGGNNGFAVLLADADGVVLDCIGDKLIVHEISD